MDATECPWCKVEVCPWCGSPLEVGLELIFCTDPTHACPLCAIPLPVEAWERLQAHESMRKYLGSIVEYYAREAAYNQMKLGDLFIVPKNPGFKRPPESVGSGSDAGPATGYDKALKLALTALSVVIKLLSPGELARGDADLARRDARERLRQAWAALKGDQ